MWPKLSGCFSLGPWSSSSRAGKWGIFESPPSFRHGVPRSHTPATFQTSSYLRVWWIARIGLYLGSSTSFSSSSNSTPTSCLLHTLFTAAPTGRPVSSKATLEVGNGFEYGILNHLEGSHPWFHTYNGRVKLIQIHEH